MDKFSEDQVDYFTKAVEDWMKIRATTGFTRHDVTIGLVARSIMTQSGLLAELRKDKTVNESDLQTMMMMKKIFVNAVF